jgi:eight-cysteine-cluster-containing protein
MRFSPLVLALLFACGGKSNPTPTPTPGSTGGANNCVKTGCSGTVCAAEGHEVVTTCEFKPEYACYQTATCAKQADGQCGWTQTPDLTACLANPPPAAGGSAAGSAAPVM